MMSNLHSIQTKMADIHGKKRGRPRTFTDSARKRKKKLQNKHILKTRIVISDQIERWNDLKHLKNLTRGRDVAKFLLDFYYLHTEARSASRPDASTPLFPKRTYCLPLTVGLSEISSISSESKSEMNFSGVDEVEEKTKQNVNNATEVEIGQSTRSTDRYTLRTLPKKGGSTSFINPSDLSIEFSEEDDEEESDDEYEPSIDISIRQECPTGYEDLGFENVCFNVENENDDIISSTEKEMDNVGPGVQRILVKENVDDLTDDETCLVYLKPLLNLANVHIEPYCTLKGCTGRVTVSTSFVGSAVYLKWTCSNDHNVYKWCSQPLLNRGLHGGDLLSSAAVLFSGNNFSKIALFSQFLKLHFVSASVYHRIQRVYLTPVIDRSWEKEQTRAIKALGDAEVTLLGDGRMDSPGYNAQFCSYTLMENETKQIVSLVTMDKREVALKSTNLEKAAFNKSIELVKQKGVKVAEIVTDEHLQIMALLKNYPGIKHSLDIWHAAKNLGKKIIAKSQEKMCNDLKPWTKDIVNHFWHVSQTASSYEEFLDMWYGLLHHIVDEHEWVMPYADSGMTECSHGPLSEERNKDYLKKGSASHSALREIIMNNRFLKKVPYFLNFRSTAELEVFQQQILMYAAKRFSYSPPIYRVRNLLAALDHNQNFNREFLKNKDGEIRYQRLFSKKSQRWTVVPVKGKKNYNHVFAMIREVVIERIMDTVGMHRPMTLEVNDPRRIHKQLAPIPPPTTADIVATKISRR